MRVCDFVICFLSEIECLRVCVFLYLVVRRSAVGRVTLFVVLWVCLFVRLVFLCLFICLCVFRFVC